MTTETEFKATSISTLLESISSAKSDLDMNHGFWFRGHTCGDTWKLVPHVHRTSGEDTEQQLLLKFQLKAPSRYNKCPPIDDYPAWTSLAQHYGLPTRLLDWTGSPLVAAYFASLENEKKEAGTIWLLNAPKMNSIITKKKASVYTFRAEECLRMITAGWYTGNNEEYEYIASVPDEIDLRLALQQSSFTIHKGNNPLEDHGNAREFLRKITIPYESKETLREELDLLGFRKSTIFPDLASLAKCLKSSHE